LRKKQRPRRQSHWRKRGELRRDIIFADQIPSAESCLEKRKPRDETRGGKEKQANRLGSKQSSLKKEESMMAEMKRKDGVGLAQERAEEREIKRSRKRARTLSAGQAELFHVFVQKKKNRSAPPMKNTAWQGLRGPKERRPGPGRPSLGKGRCAALILGSTNRRREG